MHIVWELQMPRRQKIALAALLCIGLVAVAGSIAHLPLPQQELTHDSRLRTLLLCPLPRKRDRHLVLHGRLTELVQHRDLCRYVFYNLPSPLLPHFDLMPPSYHLQFCINLQSHTQNLSTENLGQLRQPWCSSESPTPVQPVAYGPIQYETFRGIDGGQGA
jgi:hypothetical protein